MPVIVKIVVLAAATYQFTQLHVPHFHPLTNKNCSVTSIFTPVKPFRGLFCLYLKFSAALLLLLIKVTTLQEN
jgi:hypothetical protein